MSYTATKIKTDVHGSQRVIEYSVAADAVSGIVATGLSVIDVALISPISMATGGVKVKRNATTAAAAANGTVNIADAANGDDFFLIVFGH